MVEKDHTIGTKRAGLILGLVFASALFLIFGIYRNLPDIEASERENIKLPKNVEDAKKLAIILSKYKEKYYTTVVCGLMVAYIFLQSFAIPGSLFLTVLAGYLFNFPVALVLVSLCSAIGASLCYSLSCFVGRPIVKRLCPEKLSQWSIIVEENRDNLLYFMIFLRITPFAPNWFINLSSPLLEVPFVTFFFGTLIGVLPPCAVYVIAGQTLTTLSSAQDIFSLNVVLSLFLVAIISISPVIFRGDGMKVSMK